MQVLQQSNHNINILKTNKTRNTSLSIILSEVQKTNLQKQHAIILFHFNIFLLSDYYEICTGYVKPENEEIFLEFFQFNGSFLR